MKLPNEVPSHPSYKLLRLNLGLSALKAILELWMDAEIGGTDGSAPENYAEAEADWRRAPEALMRPLLETGCVKRDEEGIYFVANIFIPTREGNAAFIFPPTYMPKTENEKSA